MEKEDLAEQLRSAKARELEKEAELERKREELLDYDVWLHNATVRALGIFKKVGAIPEDNESSNLIPLGLMDAEDKDSQTHGFAQINIQHSYFSVTTKRKLLRRPVNTVQREINRISVLFFAGTESADSLRLVASYALPRDYRKWELGKPRVSLDQVLSRMEIPATRNNDWENFARNQQALNTAHEALELIEKELGIEQHQDI